MKDNEMKKEIATNLLNRRFPDYHPGYYLLDNRIHNSYLCEIDGGNESARICVKYIGRGKKYLPCMAFYYEGENKSKFVSECVKFLKKVNIPAIEVVSSDNKKSGFIELKYSDKEYSLDAIYNEIVQRRTVECGWEQLFDAMLKYLSEYFYKEIVFYSEEREGGGPVSDGCKRYKKIV